MIVFNNVAARMRQLGPNIDEASADLGADQLQTFWHVRLPLLATSLLAGALLAFALSFDEIIVTTFTAAGGFQTLPLWIFQNMFRDTSLPLVNVTATFVVIVMVVPVYLAQRLSDATAGGRDLAARRTQMGPSPLEWANLCGARRPLSTLRSPRCPSARSARPTPTSACEAA